MASGPLRVKEVDPAAGLLRIEGAAEARQGELLQVGEGWAQVVALRADAVMAARLDTEPLGIVRCTGQFSRSAPEAFGRVIDGLGRPLDGGGPPSDVALPAYPQTAARELWTGVRAVDLMAPLSRGESRFVLGDRESGKSTLCLTAAIWHAQTRGPVVWCGLGVSRNALRWMRGHLAGDVAKDRIVVVASHPAMPPAATLLAFTAASALARGLAKRGLDVLLVVDDLNEQAKGRVTLDAAVWGPVHPQAQRARVAVETWTNLDFPCAERGSVTSLVVVGPAPELQRHAVLAEIEDEQGIWLSRERILLGKGPMTERGLRMRKLGHGIPLRSSGNFARMNFLHLATLQRDERYAPGLAPQLQLDWMWRAAQRVDAMLVQPAVVPCDPALTFLCAAIAIGRSFDHIGVDEMLPRAGRALDRLRETQPEVLDLSMRLDGYEHRSKWGALDAAIAEVCEHNHA